VGVVYAHDGQHQSNMQQTFIQKMVQKFGLKESEVQAVFDEARKEHISQIKARFEEKLNTAVKNGELTEEKKQIILGKQQELEKDRSANLEKLKNMTQDERRQALEKQKSDLEQWAKQNSIDLKYFIGGYHRPFGGMRGGQ
jgi:hypothetical protein